MRSRVRYGIADGSSGGDFVRLSRNEHKILRLFCRPRANIFRFPAPRIERSKYLAWSFPPPSRPVLSSSRLHFDCTSTAPLDPRLGPRRISHITFRSLLLLCLNLLSSSSPSPPLPSSSLAPAPSSRLVRSKRFYTRACEIAFKLFGFLTRQGFIVRNPCRIEGARRGCRAT